MTREIDILLFDGVNLLDVSGPVQAFEAANLAGSPRYRTRFVAAGGRAVRACCGLQLVPDCGFAADGIGNDLLIPGGAGVDRLLGDTALLDLIRQYAAGPGRMISVCSGAMILAEAGVRDGLPATTHWSRQEQVRNYPEVAWDLDRISVSQGKVFTSAGVTTGIDLALAIIVQLRRTGGQSQYAFHLAGQFTGDGTLAQLIERVVARPGLDWTLETMADVAGMNTRTLTRRFKRDLDETPAQFVEKVRVDHARGLLREDMPLKRIATESGFGDLQRMRRAFRRRFGVQVGEYRAMFAGPDAVAASARSATGP